MYWGCQHEQHRPSPGALAIRQEEMAGYKKTLRCMALNNQGFVDSVLGIGRDTVEVSGLDQNSCARPPRRCAGGGCRLPSSYQPAIEMAFAAGASIDEIVGVLIAVAPVVGLARAVSAGAPELALALGYDLDAALEAPEVDDQ